MIDVHFAIDLFDGTLNQRWYEAALEARLPSQVLSARELLPALYACGVRYISYCDFVCAGPVPDPG